MKESNHFPYATKVWLTSVFLSPLLAGIYFGTMDGNFLDTLPIVAIMITFGFMCSIPNWLIFIFIVKKINETKLKLVEKKVVINLLAVILIFALFMIVFQGYLKFDPEILVITLPYTASLTLGIWKCDLISPSLSQQEEALNPNLKMLEDILDDENY